MLNEKGLILTNDHVIKGATSLTVDASGSSKKTTSAKIVGEEANQDLALIKVDPSGLGLKPLHARELELGPGRRHRVRDRHSLRPRRDLHQRHRLGPRPRNRRTGRVEDQRRDPDRCGAQPRQLRRAAARRTGRSDRRELADRQRRGPDRGLPAREHRRWLRDLLEHRRSGREEDRGRRRGQLRLGDAGRGSQSEGGGSGSEESPYGGRSESPYGEVEAGGGSGATEEGAVEAGGSGSSGVEGSARAALARVAWKARRRSRLQLERLGIPRRRGAEAGS